VRALRRVVGHDNCVTFLNLKLQIRSIATAATLSEPRCACVAMSMTRWPYSTARAAWLATAHKAND